MGPADRLCEGRRVVSRHHHPGVREETGLTVTVGELARLRSGYRLRVEVAYEATCTGGHLRLGSLEILEARWFPTDSLPAGILDAHLALIRKIPIT